MYENHENEGIYKQVVDFSVSGNGRSDFSNCHNITRKADRSITSDLEKINLPDDVKIVAADVFRKLITSTKRGRRRKKLLFYCIFVAYIELKQPMEPKTIAELVGISSTEMTKAFSMCSETQTNYKTPIIRWKPLDFIPEYIEKLGLDADCLDDVNKLADDILNKDPDLYESYPQVVAGGIIMYFMYINGVVNIDKKLFAKVLMRSEMTISKMFKRIAQVHSS